MKILEVVENKDGSAKLEMMVSRKEIDFLVELGVNKILEESLANFEKNLTRKKMRGGGIKRCIK